jgi:hypothetical protein
MSNETDALAIADMGRLMLHLCMYMHMCQAKLPQCMKLAVIRSYTEGAKFCKHASVR